MKERLAIARILHFGLLFPPTILLGVFYYLRSLADAPSTGEPALTYAAMVLALVSPVISRIVSGQLFKAAAARFKEDLSTTEAQTVATYQSAKIVQWALLEGPALFQAVIFYLTGEIILLGLGGLLLAILAMQGPSQADLQKRLEISDTRLRQIQAASS